MNEKTKKNDTIGCNIAESEGFDSFRETDNGFILLSFDRGDGSVIDTLHISYESAHFRVFGCYENAEQKEKIL